MVAQEADEVLRCCNRHICPKRLATLKAEIDTALKQERQQECCFLDAYKTLKAAMRKRFIWV